jgi:hypothetical protein
MRYGRWDHPGIPIYATVPDIPLDAHVVHYRRQNTDDSYCNFPQGAQGWQDEQGCDPVARPQCGCECTPQPDVAWSVYWRQLTYDGKQVQYAGLSETQDVPGSKGPCEEWWFAEDVGPIFIAKYPNKTRGNCETLLNASTINNPQQHLDGRLNELVGYIRLVDKCLVEGQCRVDS